MDDLSRRALTVISSRQLLSDRGALDAVAAPVRTLHPPSGPLPEGRLVAAAEMFAAALPDELTASAPLVDDDAVSVPVGDDAEAVLRFAADHAGNLWVVTTVRMYAGRVDGSVWEDRSAAVNELNKLAYGFSWRLDDRSLSVFTSSAVPLAEVGRIWALCWAVWTAELVAVASAATRMFLSDGDGDDESDVPPEHPLTVRHRLEDLLRADTDAVFTLGDVTDAVDGYGQTLSPALRRVVGAELDDDSVVVRVPFLLDGRARRLEVRLFTLAAHEADGPLPRLGVHLVANFPEELAAADAARWCAVLNDVDGFCGPPADRRVTTPWLLGTWRSYETPSGRCHVGFHGVVPNGVRGLVDLTDVVGGAVREAWWAWDRFRLDGEFTATVASVTAAGGDDVR